MDRSKLFQDGAKYLGIFFLLIIITLFIPLIGMVSIFFLSIPFVIFTKKHGLKYGIVLGLFAFFLMFIVTPLSLPIVISFAAGGIVIGELYRRGKEAFAVLLGGSLSYTFALLLNYIGSIVLLDKNPMEVFQNLLRESMEVSEQMLALVGQQGEEVLEVAYTFIDQLIYVAPTIIIMLGVSYAFIVQLLSIFVLRRVKEEADSFPPLRTWSFPKAFIWYYLITYIFILIGVEEGSSLHMVIANLSPIIEMVMIIQGFAFFFFFFYKKNKSKAIPVILLILSFIFPIFLQIVIILGIIDLGFDLRKRMDSPK